MTKISRQKKARSKSQNIPSPPLKLWQDHANIQEVQINIIPLIDVIFCILTFFILAAVGFSRQQAIGLDLPKAKTGTPQMREMLIVSLDDFGQIYVEKQTIASKQQLYQVIQNYTQLNPNGLMVLNASKNASYREVVEVLDMLREVGGERVALATLPGNSANNSQSNNPTNSSSGNNQPLPYGTQLPGTNLNSLPQNTPSNPTQSQPGGFGFQPLTPNGNSTVPLPPSNSPNNNNPVNNQQS